MYVECACTRVQPHNAKTKTDVQQNINASKHTIGPARKPMFTFELFKCHTSAVKNHKKPFLVQQTSNATHVHQVQQIQNSQTTVSNLLQAQEGLPDGFVAESRVFISASLGEKPKISRSSCMCDCFVVLVVNGMPCSMSQRIETCAPDMP